MNLSSDKKFFKLLSVILFSIFSFYLFLQVRNAPLLYDDSVMASVAKNLAKGVGYATSYDRVKQFDHIITTGPVMILPASLLVSIFGNKYWVPNLSSAIIVFILLLILIFGIMRRYLRDGFYYFLSLFSLTAFWIVDETSNSGEYRYFKPWYSLLGEVTGFLLMTLGVYYFLNGFGENKSLNHKNRKKIFFGSICFAMALLTKFIFILPLFCFFTYFLIKNHGYLSAHRVKLLCAFATSLTPLIIYNLLRMSLLNPEEGSFLSFFSKNASGLGEMKSSSNVVLFMLANCFHSLLSLMYFCGGILGFIVIVGIFCHTFRVNLKNLTLDQVLPHALIIMGLSILGWWFLFSPYAWIRHVLPGILFLWMAMLILISRMDVQDRTLILGIIMFVLLVFRHDLIYKIRSGLVIDSRVSAQVETAKKLDEIKTDQTVFLGCAWWANRDLEYLMKDELNFKNCQTLDQTALNGKEVYLVRNSDFWNWENAQSMKDLETSCDRQVIWKKERYRISRCEN